jgi:type I restriction enzyme S subunit
MKRVKLGEILEITSSKRIFESDYVSSGVPFFRGKEISQKEKGEKITELLFISQEKYEKIKKKYPIPQKGDILLTSVGSIGIPYLVDDEEFYFKDGNLTWFRNFNERIESMFLYYWMLSKEFKSQISNNKIGAVQKALTIINLQEMEISLPDLPTQSAIANLLSSLDNKIELNNKINQELEVTAKDLYNYWFVQFDFPDKNGKPYKSSGGKMIWNNEVKLEVPVNWEVKQLKNIVSFDRGISYTSDSINNKNGMPMINLGSIDIKRNYRPGQLKYYAGKINQDNIVKKFDMLIACTDLTRSCDIIGSPVLVPEEYEKYIYSMDLAKISVLDGISEMYIYESLRTKFYHNYIKYYASGTNVMHLDLNGINWYKLWLPPINIQEKFSYIIKSIYEKKINILNENSNLAQLRDFLLPLLMNGQVTISGSKELVDNVISFKAPKNHDQQFGKWLKNQGIAARGKIDLQTLRLLFDAMDDDDK